jgi:hypothetical protein
LGNELILEDAAFEEDCYFFELEEVELDKKPVTGIDMKPVTGL